MKTVKLKLGDTIYSSRIEKDRHEIQKCSLLLINNRGSYSQVEGFYCSLCKKAYSDNLDYLKNKFVNYNYLYISKNDKNLRSKFDLNGKFITKLGNVNAEKHNFVDIIAIVPVLNPKGKIESVQVPALLDEDCYHFYILEPEIKLLENKGQILCKVVTEEYWKSVQKKEDSFNLKSESILHKMGYNVNSRFNLSTYERQKILRDVISSGVLTKAEICSHIDYLISRSEGRPKLKNALIKWKKDRQFVSNIELDVQKIEATEIMIRRRHV